jgi:hypothetical protein
VLAVSCPRSADTLRCARLLQVKTYSDDICWLMVWKRKYCGKSYSAIRKDLSAGPRLPGPSPSTIRRVLRYFYLTGDVRCRTRRRRRDAIFGYGEDRALVKTLLDEPGDMLTEIRRKFNSRTGLKPHISTICQAVRRLGFTRTQVRSCCLLPAALVAALTMRTSWQLRAFNERRSAHRARKFWLYICRNFRRRQLFFLDETSKDGRALRRRARAALPPPRVHEPLLAFAGPLATQSSGRARSHTAASISAVTASRRSAPWTASASSTGFTRPAPSTAPSSCVRCGIAWCAALHAPTLRVAPL